MNRKLTAAIAWLLFAVGPAIAADVQVAGFGPGEFIAGFGPTEIAAADQIGLTGPTEAVSGDEVTIRMTGTPPFDITLPGIDQLGWLIDEEHRMFCYLAVPGGDLVPLDVRCELVFGAAGSTIQPLMRVTCGPVGEYRVLVDWNHGQNQLVDHRVMVRSRGDPDPPPDPTPPPPPDKITGMWVIVVEETNERTPAQWATMADPACRQWITTNGHQFRMVDRDSRDESGQPPANMASWIEKAEGEILPYVYCAQPDGGARHSGPLPGSGAEFLELLKQYGAEK